MNSGRPIFTQNNQNQYEMVRLRQMLTYSIRNRLRSIEIINKLIAESPDNLSTSFLERLRANDELSLDKFYKLYSETYGNPPEITIPPEETSYSTYKDGLILALRLKMDAVALARTFISLLSENAMGKSLFDNTVILDLEQENIINTLYSHSIGLE